MVTSVVIFYAVFLQVKKIEGDNNKQSYLITNISSAESSYWLLHYTFMINFEVVNFLIFLHNLYNVVK